MIKFIKEIKSVISNNAPLKEAIIFATDTKEMFIDIDNVRIQINDIFVLEKVEDLNNLSDPLSNKFYFVEENNLLYKYKDNKWVTITSTYAQYKELTELVQDLTEKYERLTTEVNIEYLLEASKWVGNKYIINDPLFTSESTIKLSAPSVTNSQYTALSSAKIMADDSDFENNNLILEATGDVPAIDIPIQISVFISSETLQNVHDNLNSTSRVNPLSANMGRVLNETIGDLNTLKTTDKTDVVSAVNELFQDVDSGKALVASAITDKGIPTPQDATFKKLSEYIGYIVTSPAAELVKDVTTTQSNVLEGKKFINNLGLTDTGTMPNNISEQKILNPGETYNINQGYHDGTGTVNVPTLSDLTPGTAEAENILNGKIAYVNGIEVTGTMPNNVARQEILNPGNTYCISQGYHNGTGSISVPTLESLTPGTADPAKILLGEKAYVNGIEVTGSIKTFNGNYSYRSKEVKQVLDTTNKYLTSDIVVEPLIIEGEKTVVPTTEDQIIEPASGNDGLSKVTVKGDSNLSADNIKEGVSIFGVVGELKFEDNVFISNTEPTNPPNPSVWLDTTNDKNILKIYDGTKWNSVHATWA